MKKWNKPEIGELAVDLTHTGICYCENGKCVEPVTYKGGKEDRPGHEHKPQGGPDRPNGPCPSHPSHKPSHKS